MTVLFAQQVEDASATEGMPGVVRLWIRCLIDLVATAPTEHLEKDVLVAQPVVGLDQSRTRPDRAQRIAWMIAALAPAFMILLLYASAPHYMDPMFNKPPETFGVSVGSLIIGLSVVWYAIGVALVGAASGPRQRLVAFILFIFPATFAFLFGPALILILQNLTATRGD